MADKGWVVYRQPIAIARRAAGVVAVCCRAMCFSLPQMNKKVASHDLLLSIINDSSTGSNYKVEGVLDGGKI